MTKHLKAQGSSKGSGSDNGGTRTSVYLGSPAETFPHGAGEAFLALLSRFPADRRKYWRSDIMSLLLGVLRLNSEISIQNIGGYCWPEKLNLQDLTALITPIVECQISGMIWLSGGMRTENSLLSSKRKCNIRKQNRKLKIMWSFVSEII